VVSQDGTIVLQRGSMGTFLFRLERLEVVRESLLGSNGVNNHVTLEVEDKKTNRLM
jgi:hypothetical protein